MRCRHAHLHVLEYVHEKYWFQKFGLPQASGSQVLLADVSPSSNNNIVLTFSDGSGNSASLLPGKGTPRHSVSVPGWPDRSQGVQSAADYVTTQDHDATLAQMLLSHQSADFCLVGDKVRCRHGKCKL